MRYRLSWVPLTALLVLLDLTVGWHVPVPAMYAIPVLLAAWKSGLAAGLTLAVLLPFVRLTAMPSFTSAEGAVVAINITTRAVTFAVLAVMASRLAAHERRLSRENEMLSRLLPICMFCKSIREAGSWVPLESYFHERRGTEFSHGICPACAQTHYPTNRTSFTAPPRTASPTSTPERSNDRASVAAPIIARAVDCKRC